jgi:predicted amidophosphoribosyltransferase
MWVEAVRRPLRSVLDSIAVVLLPCDCRVCGQPLVRLSRIPVCDDCLQSLSPADVNACCVCGEALGRSSVDEPVTLCGICRRAHPHFDFAICFAAYDGALRGAFVAGLPERLPNRIVLLIDDVYTTSTTLNECARVLRKAGAKPVIVRHGRKSVSPGAEIAPGGVANREENAAVFAEAVAG